MAAHTQTVFLAWLAGISTVLVAGIAWGMIFLFGYLPDEGLEKVGTNVATIGGIASGLSLAGFTTLLTNSKAMDKLSTQYGDSVRWILLGGYSFMVVSSLASGIAVGFADGFLPRLIIAVATGVISVGLIVTSLLINSMFGWISKEKYL